MVMKKSNVLEYFFKPKINTVLLELLTIINQKAVVYRTDILSLNLVSTYKRNIVLFVHMQSYYIQWFTR